VFLYDGTESYSRHVRHRLGRRPSSRLGIYLPTERTLHINVGSGYGWLCHELWHALGDFDWPGRPAWLDEGMASLFEEPRFRAGKIEGTANWRAWILHEYMAVGRFVPLSDLLATTPGEFYSGPRRAVHYAEARALCLYLQERGVLERFYARFRDGREKDPKGRRALCEVLGAERLDEVESAWKAWLRDRPGDSG
jgi:hypothetical protein